MPRRGRRPSKYRFVRFPGVPLACAGVLVMSRIGAAVTCSMLHTASPTSICTPYHLPRFITLALWVAILIGVGLAGWRWYQDFVNHAHLAGD